MTTISDFSAALTPNFASLDSQQFGLTNTLSFVKSIQDSAASIDTLSVPAPAPFPVRDAAPARDSVKPGSKYKSTDDDDHVSSPDTDKKADAPPAKPAGTSAAASKQSAAKSKDKAKSSDDKSASSSDSNSAQDTDASAAAPASTTAAKETDKSSKTKDGKAATADATSQDADPAAKAADPQAAAAAVVPLVAQAGNVTIDPSKTGDKKAADKTDVAANTVAATIDPAQAATAATVPLAAAAAALTPVAVDPAAAIQSAPVAKSTETGKSAKAALLTAIEGKAGAAAGETGKSASKDAAPASATNAKASDNQTSTAANDANAGPDFSALVKDGSGSAPAAAANLVQSLTPATATKAAAAQTGPSETAPVAGAGAKAAADSGTANLAAPAQTQTTSDTAKATAASQTQAAPRVPVTELGTYVARMAKTGENNFDLRLDPLDLGRVDVKVEITESGKINATFLVERKETLEMLQKDSSQLQQAFENAGLKADSNSLSFSLKDQSNSGNQGNPKAFRSFSQYDLNPDSTQAANDAAVPVRATTALRALDISI
jgi:flagellar hook-length control protein FliK